MTNPKCSKTNCLNEAVTQVFNDALCTYICDSCLRNEHNKIFNDKKCLFKDCNNDASTNIIQDKKEIPSCWNCIFKIIKKEQVNSGGKISKFLKDE